MYEYMYECMPCTFLDADLTADDIIAAASRSTRCKNCFVVSVLFLSSIYNTITSSSMSTKHRSLTNIHEPYLDKQLHNTYTHTLQYTQKSHEKQSKEHTNPNIIGFYHSFHSLWHYICEHGWLITTYLTLACTGSFLLNSWLNCCRCCGVAWMEGFPFRGPRASAAMMSS